MPIYDDYGNIIGYSSDSGSTYNTSTDSGGNEVITPTVTGNTSTITLPDGTQVQKNADNTYSIVGTDGTQTSITADQYNAIQSSAGMGSDVLAAQQVLADTPPGQEGGVKGLLSGINSALGLTGTGLELTPGNLTTAAGISTLLGGNNIKTGISTATIPQLNAVNQQIAPGQAGQGQNYFTPMQYVTPGQTSQAISLAKQQAQNMAPTTPAPAAPVQPNINTAWQSKGQAVQANTPFTNPQQSTGIQQIATPQQLQAIQSQIADLQQNPAQVENLGGVHAAHGGMMPGGIAEMSHGGRYLQGSTDGMADKLDTSIDGVQPAKLSHGEFVVPADVVSHLGNGNSDAGAKKLYQMMDKIRMARTGTKKQGKEINPDKFMPGGIAGYATGGNVKHFATGSGATSVASSTPSSTTAVTPSVGMGTTQATGLSPYIGQYVTNMLGQQQALANAPMPVYQGELAAGPSSLQQQQFANASQLAQTGLTPTQFTSGTFDANAAQQYMNPYLQASLDPQLAALQRTAQQGEQGDLSKLTQAGAFGGTRQAVLQGQDAYNLLAQQSGLIGSGYNTAYTNAMNQFNTANLQSLQAQQNQEAANEAAANYGLAANQALGTAGATQQQLKQAQDTASLNQFNQQAQYPQTVLTNESSLLNNLPISTAAVTPNTSTLGNIQNDLSGLLSIYNQLGGSSGTTGSGNGSSTTPTPLPPYAPGDPTPTPLPMPDAPTSTSDIRAKENIELIDIRPDGLGIYEFEYRPEFKNTPTAGHGRYRGLMAQEVEKIYPNAVVTLDSGYKAIKYAEVPA